MPFLESSGFLKEQARYDEGGGMLTREWIWIKNPNSFNPFGLKESTVMVHITVLSKYPLNYSLSLYSVTSKY